MASFGCGPEDVFSPKVPWLTNVIDAASPSQNEEKRLQESGAYYNPTRQTGDATYTCAMGLTILPFDFPIPCADEDKNGHIYIPYLYN